jgi:diacylglycerol kinase (ATP)
MLRRSMKTCIILNPIAGSVDDVTAIQERLRPLQASQFSLSDKPGDAEKAARDAIEQGCDLIVSAGGDGTLNEVVNGIAATGCKATLAVLPLGTGNDFARTLGAPDDLEQAIEQIDAGRIREIDLVRVTSDLVRYFINVSSGGFSGLVDEKLTPEMKRTWGPLAYLRCAAAAFPEMRAYNTNVLFDDAERLEVDLYNVVIANGRYVAGGIPIAPEADIADGLLDIILIPQRGTAEMALLATKILLGQHLSAEPIIFKRAKRVMINSNPGMWFNVDGELIGNEPATFELLPRAIRCVAGGE